jgi:hypothetical protein
VAASSFTQPCTENQGDFVPNVRHHFAALLKKINPPDERVTVASTRVGEVRDWLRDHEFETQDPHTLLSGSYRRSTAIELIPDVDVLLFVPASQEQRTPNAVLSQLRGLLKDYPNAGVADVQGQRRSVRLELPNDQLCLDIVPAIAKNGVGDPLLVPDRPQKTWIMSDPLGYATRLTEVNKNHAGKLVPLVKLLKAWRDEHMFHRRPKSYVLEVMLLYGVEDGDLPLCGRSRAENVHDALTYIADKYGDLMDNGSEAPRIRDPQIAGTFITRGWSRGHFETFMRRIRDARRAAGVALAAPDDTAEAVEWRKVFGSRWPTDDEVKDAVREEARCHQPGLANISPSGLIIGGPAVIATQHTTFHGS